MNKRILLSFFYIHFPLWIIKDSAWFFGLNYEAYTFLKYISLSFAIITILISILLIYNSESKLSRYENIILTVWLAANSSWMLSEMFSVNHAHTFAFGFFIIGLLLIPFYLYTAYYSKNLKI